MLTPKSDSALTPRSPSALKRRVSSLGGKPSTPDGSPLAGAAAIARAAGFGMESPRTPETRPKRLSRVSFASPKDTESSPEKEQASATDDLPPSPCRGQRSNRSTYSFGRLSVAESVDHALAELPSSPPESPGRWRQTWTCLKQQWEEMEIKQRELEEMDFDLKEEKKQQRESRLFLARKMSELEARELRSAKERERLSLASTPCSLASTPDRTPGSSRRSSRTPSRGTPTHILDSPMKEPEELVHAAVQTEEAVHVTEEASSWRRSCRPSFLCIAVMLAKAIYVAGVVILPELPAETLAEMAAWVPGPLRGVVSFEIGRQLQDQNESIAEAVVNETTSLQVDGSCEEALQQTRLALTSLKQQQHDLPQPHAAREETAEEQAEESPNAPLSPHDVEIQPPAQQNWWLSSLFATSTTMALVAIRHYV